MKTICESRPVGPSGSELNRLIQLAEYGLDYAALQHHLDDLTRLAALVTGAPVSVINLIDQHTQWTVAREGTDLKQMPREDSVCQYTMMGDEPLIIEDLAQDTRTCDKFYVGGETGFRSYFGIPLQDSRGCRLGALCVLDREVKTLGERERATLKQISQSVIRRLDWIREVHQLKMRLKQMHEQQRRVSHDLRGPLGGIIGLAEIMGEQLNGQDANLSELVGMIRDSGQGLLDFCDKLLMQSNAHACAELGELVERLRAMFVPQAMAKGVTLEVKSEPGVEALPCDLTMLLQMFGNVISNAIKFTSLGGTVKVMMMERQDAAGRRVLQASVTDNGVGMDAETIARVMQGEASSSMGTDGEIGYGLGLRLVRHLAEQSGAHFEIRPAEGGGTQVRIELPYV